MGKTAKKSFLASLTCALVLWAAPVRGEEESVLKAGPKAGSFEYQGTKLTRSEAPNKPLASSNNGDSLRLMGLWLVLFGAGAGTLVLWYRKRQGLSLGLGKPARKLQIVERLPLGHRREVLVIKACDRLLIVASHADQTTLLSDLAADDVESAAPAFDVLYTSTGMKAANERLLRAEAQMRNNVSTAAATAATVAQAKSKLGVPAPQPWPEMEKA